MTTLHRSERAEITGLERNERTETVERVGEGSLVFRFGRRQLVSELLEWLRVADTSRTTPALKLTDLATMDPEQLAAVRPMIAPGGGVSARDGWVWVQPPGAMAPIPLVPTSGPAVAVFNAINGLNTVAQIADAVAAATGWSDERAFEFCRSTVLDFIGLRVCIPAGR